MRLDCLSTELPASARRLELHMVLEAGERGRERADGTTRGRELA